MNNQLPDSYISDLTMTLKFYQERSHGSVELEELLEISGHLLEVISSVRRRQLIRTSNGLLSDGQGSLIDAIGGGTA